MLGYCRFSGSVYIDMLWFIYNNCNFYSCFSVYYFISDKLVFVGYKGSFKPEWVKLAVGEDTALLHEVLPIPITKKLKL